MSPYISAASSSGARYFAGSVAVFGGGVVPQGSVRYEQDGKAIRPEDVRLYVTEAGPGLRYRGDFYALDAHSLPLEPLARFVQRGTRIAFTIPPVDPSDRVLRDNDLRPVTDDQAIGLVMSYFFGIDSSVIDSTALPELLREAGVTPLIASEFVNTPYEPLLADIDLNTAVEALPEPELLIQLLESIHGEERPQPTADGSYVNADFHTTYVVELRDSPDGKHVVMSGPPLRYHWDVAGSVASVWDVEVYADPEKLPDDARVLQRDAIAFFQTAAVLRENHERDPKDYELFLAVLSGQASYGPSRITVAAVVVGSVLLVAGCLFWILARRK